MEQDKIRYNFETVDDTDYIMEFWLMTKSQLLYKIFNESVKKLIAKGQDGLKEADINTINRFDLDPRFYNLVRTALSKQIKQCRSLVEKDRIIVLNNAMEGGHFERKGEEWEIYIKLGGQYARK